MVAPEPLPTSAEPEARARDAAWVLPLLGLLLLMPPVIVLFAVPFGLAGVPLIVVYVFGVWLALVVAAALLGHRLLPDPPPPKPACSRPS